MRKNSRLDQCCRDSVFFLQKFYCSLPFSIERTGSEDCHFFPCLYRPENGLSKVFFYRKFIFHHVGRSQNQHRPFPLLQAVVQHSKVFLFKGRCQNKEIRNRVRHRGKIKTEVCLVAHPEEGGAVHHDCNRERIDSRVMRYLIIGSL